MIKSPHALLDGRASTVIVCRRITHATTTMAVVAETLAAPVALAAQLAAAVVAPRAVAAVVDPVARVARAELEALVAVAVVAVVVAADVVHGGPGLLLLRLLRLIIKS
jgi:hypothetical protein